MRKVLFILCFLGSSLGWSMQAQTYLYEMGVGAGVSSAYGDVNQGTFFYHPEMAMTAHFRYLYNVRWSFSGEFLTAGLSGNSEDFTNKFPAQAVYRFKSRLWQLSGNAEFNFLNYGMGADYRNLARFSPYLAIGIGLGGVSGDAGAFSFSIPMGVGMRYKLSPRWGIALKMVFAKMFTDQADGVKDPYGIESSGVKNTDWYSSCEMSISYSFGERKRNCNNID